MIIYLIHGVYNIIRFIYLLQVFKLIDRDCFMANFQKFVEKITSHCKNIIFSTCVALQPFRFIVIFDKTCENDVMDMKSVRTLVERFIEGLTSLNISRNCCFSEVREL